MNSNSFIFSQKVIGQERKIIAAVIAETLDVGVKYAGVPTFAYEAGGWEIGKDNVIKSPETEFSEAKTLRSVIEALKKAGFIAEGSAAVTFSKEGYMETTLENISNLIKSKESLLKKALGIDEDILVTGTETEISFAFYAATLKADELLAYIALTWKLSEQAKTQKYANPKEKPAENEKYAFRCFLLRLGFIGDIFKNERKALLARLEGNGAFRQMP